MTNGLSHPYQLDESTFCFREYFFFISISVLMKFMSANRITPDGTPHLAASHPGLFCLPMSHKKDVRLIWVSCTQERKKELERTGWKSRPYHVIAGSSGSTMIPSTTGWFM